MWGPTSCMSDISTSQAVDTVRAVIDRQAEAYGNVPFIIDPYTQRRCTFKQLQLLCRQLCNAVSASGVQPADSVAFAMNNGLDAAVAVLGLQYGGYRAVAINLVAGCEIIGYVLSHSESKMIITQPSLVSTVGDALQSASYAESQLEKPLLITLETADDESNDLTWLNTGENGATTALSASDALAEIAKTGQTYVTNDTTEDIVAASTDGLLMYTSGTTGRPKGVVLSHANLLAGGRNVCDGHELTSNDRALCVLPLFHINGLCVTLLGPLVSGGSVVMPERFSTSRFWQWIERCQCTWFSVVPTQIAYLLRDASAPTSIPGLRFGRSASAPLSPDVHGSFEATFGVPMIETMGLTETSAQILSNPMPPGRRKLGSPGVPVGVSLRVVNASGQDVPSGEEGELWVKGDNVMGRYFKNPDATRDAVTESGWLRTGDLGKVDAEGFVFVTGRLKELIIKGGENIAPREIDDALYQHPDVVEAAAFAVNCKNYGQRVEAAVSIRPESTLNAHDLLGLVQSVVGAFKCPDKIHFLDELPKGPSGKIQRNKLVYLGLDKAG